MCVCVCVLCVCVCDFLHVPYFDKRYTKKVRSAQLGRRATTVTVDHQAIQETMVLPAHLGLTASVAPAELLPLNMELRVRRASPARKVPRVSRFLSPLKWFLSCLVTLHGCAK